MHDLEDTLSLERTQVDTLEVRLYILADRNKLLDHLLLDIDCLVRKVKGCTDPYFAFHLLQDFNVCFTS